MVSTWSSNGLNLVKIWFQLGQGFSLVKPWFQPTPQVWPRQWLEHFNRLFQLLIIGQNNGYKSLTIDSGFVQH